MTSARDRYRELLSRGHDTDRIVFFSDAVFAIAMTLLVLEIRLPQNADDDLAAALLDLWPSFAGYALSFAIIGLNWVTHHRKFSVIEGYDSTLMRLNLLFLFVVAFVPFPTSVIAEYGDETPSVILYAVTVAAMSLLQLAIWVYSHRAGLMSERVDDEVYRQVRRSLLPVPIVFLGAIPIALFAPVAATFCWIAILPVSILVRVLGERAERRRTAGPAASSAESAD